MSIETCPFSRVFSRGAAERAGIPGEIEPRPDLSFRETMHRGRPSGQKFALLTAAPCAIIAAVPHTPHKERAMPDYVVIATWNFGEIAVKAAAPLLAAGKPALDAVIAGAQAVE